jgi:hypothetical protein
MIHIAKRAWLWVAFKIPSSCVRKKQKIEKLAY